MSICRDCKNYEDCLFDYQSGEDNGKPCEDFEERGELKTFRINGVVMVDVYVEVVAETLEDAMEIVGDDVFMEEYANETVGADYNADEITDIEIVCSDAIEWHEEYSEEV